MAVKEPKTPCGGCEEREIGCHATCEKYKSYVEMHTAYKHAINTEKQKRLLVDKYVYSASVKCKYDKLGKPRMKKGVQR